MDRKNKVWLIVLIVLLILAVAGMIVSRNQLADSQTRLSQAQENTAALTSDLEAANASVASLTETLTAEQEKAAAAQAEVETLTAEVAAQQEKVTALEGEIAAAQEKAAALEGEIASAQQSAPAAETSDAESVKAELDAKVAQLETALDEANARIAELTAAAEAQTAADSAETAAQAETASDISETSGEPDFAEISNTVAPEASAALTADVDALNQQLTAIMSSDASDEEKLAQIAELEAQLNQTIADLTKISSDLEAQRIALTEAETAYNAKAAELEAANAAIADLETQIQEMNAVTESELAARAKLETQLMSAQDASAAIEAELEAAHAEYDKRVAELEAYLLSRELIDGEAHVATTAATVIEVAADGVTAECSYTNNSVSGNAVVLSIVSGDKELFCSAPIAPGESLTGMTLTEALPAGAHEATAVTTVYSEDGSVQLTSRAPVTLNVAE